jgi:hypothetical protein
MRKTNFVVALVSALVLGGISLAFGQTSGSGSRVVHEGSSSSGHPAGCYDSQGHHIKC